MACIAARKEKSMSRKPKRGGAYFRADTRGQAARRINLQRTKKDANLNREAVAQVLCYCVVAAARDAIGMDGQEIVSLTVKMNERADVYTVEKSAVGAARARKRLRERTDHIMGQPFVLPAGRAFKSANDREILAERRDAADMVTRYAAEAMQAMGKEESIGRLLEEARSNYNQFLEWAEDGEWVAYERLRRVVEDLYQTKAEVVEATGAKPIFAKEF